MAPACTTTPPPLGAMKRQGSRHPHFESSRNQYFSHRDGLTMDSSDEEHVEEESGEARQRSGRHHTSPASNRQQLQSSTGVARNDRGGWGAEGNGNDPQHTSQHEAHEVRLPPRHARAIRRSSAVVHDEDDVPTEKEEEEEREDDDSADEGGGAVRRKLPPSRGSSLPAAAQLYPPQRLPGRALQHKPSLDVQGLQQRRRPKVLPFRKTSLPASMFGSQQRRDAEAALHRQPLLDRTYRQMEASSRWPEGGPSPRDEERLGQGDDTGRFPHVTRMTTTTDMPAVDDDGYYDFEMRQRSGMRSARGSTHSFATRSRARSPSPSSRRPSASPFDPMATAEMFTTNRIPPSRKYQEINPDAPDELPPSKPAPIMLLKPKRKRKVSAFYRCFSWFWTAFTWRFTKALWPLMPSVILLMLAGILAALFNIFYDVDWEGTRSWRWMVWAGAVIAVFVVSNYVFAIIMWVLKRLIFETKVFYYINTVSTTLSCFVSSIVLLATSGTILTGWNSTPRWWITKILTALLVISILHFFVILGTKYLIVKLHREQFWESISKFLISERIIWKMAYGIRRKESVKRSHVLRKPSMHHFQNAWQWMLDKRANPYLDVTSYDMDSSARAEPPLEHSASVARVILKNLDTYCKGYLEEEDFDQFFEYEDDVQAALRLFPRGQTIDLALITEAVHRVHKDRKSLYKTLFDRENAGKVLTYIITIFFAIIMVFVVMLIFELSITEYLIPLGTFFLGFSFIFGASLKNVWEGVVLIFAVRPFDIGDRITIPGTTYPTLIVSKISLFTTTFFATDGRCFIIPNQQLYALPITQYKRSKNYAVNVSVHLDFCTPAEKIIMLREKVYEWMKQDSAPWLIRTDEDWMFWVDQIENNNKITVVFWIELQDINWQRPRFYLVPKSNLYLAIQRACEELAITYHLPDQPILLKKVQEVPADPQQPSSSALNHEKLAQFVES